MSKTATARIGAVPPRHRPHRVNVEMNDGLLRQPFGRGYIQAMSIEYSSGESGGRGRPEDVAAAARFLYGPGARYIRGHANQRWCLFGRLMHG
jgi:NAD(P)-dependent dehydrogenase (short-subunit alcohol dehydrogenase family)